MVQEKPQHNLTKSNQQRYSTQSIIRSQNIENYYSFCTYISLLMQLLNFLIYLIVSNY